MIAGEPGTGRRTLARELHEVHGQGGALVEIDCASLEVETLDAELFGREGDAGATEWAAGGTLVLHELAAAPSLLQTRLLQVLGTRWYRRVGSTKARRFSARVIATASDSVSAMIEGGVLSSSLDRTFEDIELPPLRERPEAIPPILDELGVRAEFSALSWPLNLRTLMAAVQAIRDGVRDVPSELALIDAIVAGDDAARSTYADLLSQRGDPRGELIALHLAGAPVDTWKLWYPVYDVLSLGRDWERSIGTVEVRRGFVEEISTTHTLSTVVPLLEAIVPLAPALTVLEARYANESRLYSPLLRRLRTLRLVVPGALGRACCMEIAVCPYLDRITTLELVPGNELTLQPDDLRWLAGGTLVGVRHLSLDGIRLGAAALELVGREATWKLETLSLRDCGIDDALAEQILAAPGARTLRTLEWRR